MDGREGRGLIVNNTLQTFVDKNDIEMQSLWSWANYFPTAASVYPEGSKVLLLGLGGGTLVKQLNDLGFEVDAVEIDKRIWEVSTKYFGLNPNILNITIDDARHYIKKCNKKYDIIIFDTFLSESVPEHLLTTEGLTDTKAILKENGLIMINFYGSIEGPLGVAARSVIHTLNTSKFNTKILVTSESQSSRNLIFLASSGTLDFKKTRYTSKNFGTIEDLEIYILQIDNLDLSDAILLSDQRPILSKLYMPIAKKWKESYNRNYKKYFMK